MPTRISSSCWSETRAICDICAPFRPRKPKHSQVRATPGSPPPFKECDHASCSPQLTTSDCNRRESPLLYRDFSVRCQQRRACFPKHSDWYANHKPLAHSCDTHRPPAIVGTNLSARLNTDVLPQRSTVSFRARPWTAARHRRSRKGVTLSLSARRRTTARPREASAVNFFIAPVALLIRAG